MYLNQLSRFSRSLKFRLAATYFVLFILSSLILFGFLFYLLGQTLEEKDRRIVTADFKKFSVVVNSSGADGLARWFDKKQNLTEIGDVFVRVTDRTGRSVFNHEPATMREMDRTAVETLIKAAPLEKMTRVESASDPDDAIEFYTGRLIDGSLLQVGKDTDDREELLDRFREAFYVITVLAVLSSLTTALIFALGILRPVAKLIETVERVRRGDLRARAPVRARGDELNDLAMFLNGMLEQNSKLISALTESLDAVAHDLRTPLTRLRVHAERALLANERATEKDAALGEILENTDQVIQLLDAILDVSESEAGTLKLRLGPANMRDMIADIIDVYSIVAEEKSIILQIGPMVDLRVLVDVRIKQAVANLIDNAIKFSPAASTVTVSSARAGNMIAIAVEDEGPGVEAADEARIWDRLYRADASRSRRGMGLGLSLVKAIVLAHGGSVSVSARATKGSRFEIKIPLTPA